MGIYFQQENIIIIYLRDYHIVTECVKQMLLINVFGCYLNVHKKRWSATLPLRRDGACPSIPLWLTLPLFGRLDNAVKCERWGRGLEASTCGDRHLTGKVSHQARLPHLSCPVGIGDHLANGSQRGSKTGRFSSI